MTTTATTAATPDTSRSFDNGTDEPYDSMVHEAERVATNVVTAIQECIDALRHVPEFSTDTQRNIQTAAASLARAEPARQTLTTRHHRTQSSMAHHDTNHVVRLYSHLSQTLGIERLRSLHRDARDVHNRACASGWFVLESHGDQPGVPAEETIVATTDTDTSSSSSSPTLSSLAQERAWLVQHLQLPLLTSLAQCYEILDQVPAPSHPEQGRRILGGAARSGTTPTTPKRTPPPVGLLSLRHYTDIACFLEWTVCCCTASPTLFPSHVLVSLKDRIRHQLPKAMAGRLTTPSLLWASTTARKTEKDPEKEDGKTMDNDRRASYADELRSFVSVAGRVLLLDRFRPMLLPRHLTDLLAAVLYRRELLASSSPLRQEAAVGAMVEPTVVMDAQYDRVAALLTMTTATPATSKAKAPAVTLWTTSTTPPPPPTPRIDTHMILQTYQTLLRHGRAAPAWLRRAVSDLLSAAATTHLSALVKVFVVSSSSSSSMSNDASAAAVRLAHALIVTRDQDDPYLVQLSSQVLQLLDDILLEARWVTEPRSDGTGERGVEPTPCRLRPGHVACVQTVWSILELLPDHIVEGHFRTAMVAMDARTSRTQENELHPYTSNIHRCIRRLGILFSVLPSSNTPVTKVCRFFFHSLESGESKTSRDHEQTLLGAILRLATLPSAVQSIVKEDAILVIRVFLDAMVQIDFRDSDNKSVAGVDVACVALVYSIAPCSWDSCYSFVTPIEPEAGTDDFETIYVKKEIVRDTRLYLVETAEKVSERSHFLTKLLSDAPNEQSNENQKLVSRLFHLLLLTYFSSHGIEGLDECKMPQIWQGEHIGLAQIVLLPILCETCSPEILLSNDDNDGGIFEVMKIVFRSTCRRFSLCNEKLSAEEEPFSLEKLYLRLSSSSSLFTNCLNLIEQDLSERMDSSFTSLDDEMLLSTTSILLSLLVGILEYGVQERSTSEEKLLKSFSNVLQSLSQLAHHHGEESRDELRKIFVELGEMASHAVVLVESRKAIHVMGRDVPDDTLDAPSLTTEQDSFSRQIMQARKDFKSLDAPMRARAMVILRNLANAIGEAQEMSRQDKLVSSDARKENDDYFYQILDLAVEALGDVESYVYLASIHTIVATTITRSALVVPLISFAIVSGRFLGAQDLSLEQRAKLTEALIFFIRRKGAFNQQYEGIMDLLIFGPRASESISKTDDAKAIHKITHCYFVEDNDLDRNEYLTDPESQEQYWKDAELRARTGGPIFLSEEGDVVRASRIALVCELVSVLSHAVTARYCPLLINCCIDAMRLDGTRPIRRAGASLARELFASLCREQDMILEQTEKNHLLESDVVLGAAMVEGKEDTLAAILHRCIDGNDLTDRHNKERFYDPATIARCQEALSLRKEAINGGILEASKVAIENNRRDMNPITRLLKLPRDEQKRESGISTVEVLEF